MAHDHDHNHEHGHQVGRVPPLGAARSRSVAPAPSLIQLSVPQRLAGAALLSALIWAGVWWALHI